MPDKPTPSPTLYDEVKALTVSAEGGAVGVRISAHMLERITDALRMGQGQPVDDAMYTALRAVEELATQYLEDNDRGWDLSGDRTALRDALRAVRRLRTGGALNKTSEGAATASSSVPDSDRRETQTRGAEKPATVPDSPPAEAPESRGATKRGYSMSEGLGLASQSVLVERLAKNHLDAEAWRAAGCPPGEISGFADRTANVLPPDGAPCTAWLVFDEQRIQSAHYERYDAEERAKLDRVISKHPEDIHVAGPYELLLADARDGGEGTLRENLDALAESFIIGLPPDTDKLISRREVAIRIRSWLVNEKLTPHATAQDGGTDK